MGKWQVGEVTIFPENFEILYILWKLLDIKGKCSERSEAKFSDSSQKFCQDQMFNFLDYLPCLCKFPIQNYFLA